MTERPNVARPRGTREKILNDILELIRAGEFAPGQRLPSSRQLGEQYGTSHVNAAAAMGRLAELGYVVKRRGSGMYVSRRYTPDQDAIRVHAMHALNRDLEAALNAFETTPPGCPLQRGVPAAHADVWILGTTAVLEPACSGQLLALDEFMASDSIRREDFHATGLRVGMYADHVYALPFSFATPCLLLNERLLPRKDIERAPYWTTDQFAETVARLSHDLAPRGALAYAVSFRFITQILPFFTQFGGRLTDESGKYCRLSQRESRQAFEYIRALFAVLPQPLTHEKHPIPLLLTDKLAMRQVSGTEYGALADTRNAALRAVPMPYAQYGSGSLRGAWIGIPKSCPKPERAWMLLKHLASRRTQIAMAKRRCLFPSLNEAIHCLHRATRGIYDGYARTLNIPRFAFPRARTSDLLFIDDALQGWHATDDLHDLLDSVKRRVDDRLEWGGLGDAELDYI